MSRRPRTEHDQRGSAALELCLLTPALLAVLLLIVAFGRVAEAKATVAAAARDAARAASIRGSPDSARRDAAEVTAAALASADVGCRNTSVRVDTSQLRPGGLVTATVFCTVDLSNLVEIGAPGGHTFSATARAPVDRYLST